MEKCNDCWCEHYEKNRGKCDQCLKKEVDKEKPELHVILKRRAVEQMKLGGNNKSIEQGR